MLNREFKNEIQNFNNFVANEKVQSLYNLHDANGTRLTVQPLYTKSKTECVEVDRRDFKQHCTQSKKGVSFSFVTRAKKPFRLAV